MFIFRGAVYRFSDTMQRVDSISLPKEFVPGAKNFYHGTPSKRFANKIIRDCELRPNAVASDKWSWLGAGAQSLEGRVYLTDKISYAANFAEEETRPPEPYGYIFEVKRSELRDVWLDEDFVGELICNSEAKWLTKVFHQLLEWYPEDFEELVGKRGEQSFMNAFLNCRYPEVSEVGRFILEHVADDEDALNSIFEEEMEEIQREERYTALAHLGPVKINRGWKVKKTDLEKVRGLGTLQKFSEPLKLRC